MILSPLQVKILREREAPLYALFLRIESATKVWRLWTGVGDFAATSDDDIEPNAIFEGKGILRDLPPLRSLRGGIAERVDLTFSGVDDLASEWMSPASDIEGAFVNIGMMWFDMDFQPRARIGWFWPGIADLVTSAGGGSEHTITLSVISGAMNRSGSENSYWTPAQHNQLNPTDTGFKMVRGYSIVTYRKW